MKLNRYQQAEAFYDRVNHYLLSHEAENNLLLRIARSLVRTPDQMNDRVYLATVEREQPEAKQPEAEQPIVAVAIHTPPYPLCLSKVSDFRAIELIAQDVVQIAPTRVGGLPEETIVFTQCWQDLTGQSYRLNRQSLIYQLQQVQRSPAAPGNLRLATAADQSLLLQWMTAFEAEALGINESSVAARVDQRLSQQALYLWENGEPVCLVGGNGLPDEAATIAPVYTPPEQRKRGYATTAVASLSQALLDRGCPCCLLFADSKNPTANHVYQSIGYQQICEWHEYGLGNSN